MYSKNFKKISILVIVYLNQKIIRNTISVTGRRQLVEIVGVGKDKIWGAKTLYRIKITQANFQFYFVINLSG